ncbi:glycosyltransferase family 39 protein [Candidatus Puniceispirillum sp.]|nr:glycosyltransferase family 39 protein [Candidatus Puniceispirillum sp.]
MLFFYSRSALYALMVVVSAVVLIGHHSVPPMDRDESRFAQASKQMLQSGDYVTVQFQDELRAKKPAGIYWLQSTFASFLGANKISSYRFVNLVALLATIFTLYHMALHFYDSRAAFGAAALFSSCFLVLGEAHLAKTDTLLMALALGQQWALMRFYMAWQLELEPPRHNWFWFWGCMAAGILVKGPVLPVLAGLTLVALCLRHRQASWLNILSFRRGLTLLFLLCLPWTVLVTLETNGEFLATAVKGDLLAKLKTGQESHGAPPGAYAILLCMLIWPASPLLIWAFAHTRTLINCTKTFFLLAWILPFWLLIELIPTKLPHYPLPLLPAIILLLIGGVDVLSDPKTARIRWFYFLGVALRYGGVGIGILLASIFLWGAVQFGGETSRQAVLFALLALVMASLAAWYGHQWIRQALWRPFFKMIGAAMLFHLVAFAGVLPALSRIHVSTAIAEKISTLTAKPVAISTTGFQEPSLVFLLSRDLLLLSATEAALFLIEAPGGLAIIEQRQQAVFLQAAGQLGLRLAPPIQLSGINISKGQNVIILLYRSEMFDANASKE